MNQTGRVLGLSAFCVLLHPRGQSLVRSDRTAGQHQANTKDISGRNRHVDLRSHGKQEGDAKLLGERVSRPQ